VLKTKERKKLPRINCRIIPEPQQATRPIYKKNNGNKIEQFIAGAGDIDYICGRCDNIIAQNVSQSQIASDAVFQCPNCQTFNEVE
jgi:DNA-directed RNA polymerase subunit RPC12/RpoP